MALAKNLKVVGRAGERVVVHATNEFGDGAFFRSTARSVERPSSDGWPVWMGWAGHAADFDGAAAPFRQQEGVVHRTLHL